jgi:hypothetical protein
MKASELRIGNKFYLPNEEVGTISYHEIRLMEVALDKPNYKPIPLTEEWLLKLGAKKDKIDNTYYLSELEIMLPNFFRYKTSIISRIDYVHQLQNLYFALTGEELKQQEQ